MSSLACACLPPFLDVNLRAGLHPTVYASDATETRGAFVEAQPPDGSVEWQYACMQAAMDAPPTLHAAGLPVDVRRGAAPTLSSVVCGHGLGFFQWVPPDAQACPEQRARALGDPACSLADRQARGLCVCHARKPHPNHSTAAHALQTVGGRPVCLYHGK